MLLLLFLATTLPFLRHAWPRDKTVALAAPMLLVVRALALGVGYAYGLVAPQVDVEAGTDAIGGARYVIKRIVDKITGEVGTGKTVVCRRLLHELETTQPYLFFEEISIMNRPRRRGRRVVDDTNLETRLTLFGLRRFRAIWGRPKRTRRSTVIAS